MGLLDGKKGWMKGPSMTVEDPMDQRRPGSAISREFQPKKQQNAGMNWRKQEEQLQKQQLQQNQQAKQQGQIYGFVPFKNATPLAAVYGVVRPSAASVPQVLSAADYLHATYAPPQFLRQQQHLRAESAMMARSMSMDTTGQQQLPMSRPGSDLGMYKMIPASRCQSYTTLPRPEHNHIEITEHQNLNNQPHPSDHLYTKSTKMMNSARPIGPQTQLPIYDSATDQMPMPSINGVIQMTSYRPQSVLSQSQRSPHRKNSIAAEKNTFIPSTYGGIQGVGAHILPNGKQMPGTDSGQKEIIHWRSLGLASQFQCWFGLVILMLGIARLFYRAQYAHGQEVFYGVSAVCAALEGHFAVRNRSFCLIIAAVVHSLVNLCFVFVPFLSGILPLLPFLSGSKQNLNKNGTNELQEVDIALVVLSLLQCSAAFIVTLYGCHFAGKTIEAVELLRLQNGKASDSQSSTGKNSQTSEKPVLTT